MEERKYRFISEDNAAAFERETQIALNNGYIMLSPAQYLIMQDNAIRYIREMVKNEPSPVFVPRQ
jgi:hypothetical protein